MKQILVRWNIPHGRTIMCKADISFLIDHTTQRHASQFKEVDLLAVHPGDIMVGVRQPDERDIFVLPILLERRR